MLFTFLSYVIGIYCYFFITTGFTFYFYICSLHNGYGNIYGSCLDLPTHFRGMRNWLHIKTTEEIA